VLAGTAGKFVAIMPPVARLTPAEQVEALTKGSSDLRYLLQREEVEEADQAMLYSIGVTTIARLAAFAESVVDFKKSLLDDFGMDPAAGLEVRLRITKLIVSYTSASARADKLAAYEGEQAARDLAKPLHVPEYIAMVQGYQQRWWALDERQTPSRAFLERILEGVEQDDPRAVLLSEITSRDMDDPHALEPTLDASGALRLRRSATKGSMPSNPEQLRRLITILGVGYQMVALRHSNRYWLQDLSPQVWTAFLDYILGDFVYGLVARDSHGRTLSAPSFTSVLEYELQIRKEACRRVITMRETLPEALRQSMRDAVIKERYFTTPVAMSALPQAVENSSSSSRVGPAPQASNKPKDNRQQQSNRVIKSRTKKAPPTSGGCAKVNSEGKAICFRFNNKNEGCRNAKCRFLHVCGRCFASGHAMFQCKSGSGSSSAANAS